MTVMTKADIEKLQQDLYEVRGWLDTCGKLNAKKNDEINRLRGERDDYKGALEALKVFHDTKVKLLRESLTQLCEEIENRDDLPTDKYRELLERPGWFNSSAPKMALYTTPETDK